MSLILLVAGAVAAAIWLAQRWGRTQAERDFHDEGEQNARRAREIEDEVARLGDRAVDERLHKYRRD